MYQSREEIEKFVNELGSIPDDSRKTIYLVNLILKVALDIRDLLEAMEFKSDIKQGF